MSEIIKLFGKTISLPPNKEDLIVLDGDHPNLACEQEYDKKPKTSHEELKDPATSCDNPRTPSLDEEPISPKVSKNDDQSETSISQDQTPKKPDKVIPCPRCSSMETKFCYFNNYNVNQPRHFCKNCQRYWTAGGSMRSVPVGSGRRKNKSSSASHYHNIMVPENANATVLTFGTDYNSGISDITVSDSTDKGGNSGSQESAMKNFPTLAPRVPCFGGPPWSYPPGFNPSGFPITFYPAPAYWGCTLPGPYWGCTLPEPATNSSPNSPTLGKHSRDGEDSEKRVWIPKTLRIGDPSEAVKSSIWSKLGIKNEKMDGGSLFKAFRSKCDEENRRSNMSLALQANPAALARSANFHEQV